MTDESDPFSTDSALDPFDPASGFAHPPASSRYAPDFVQRYRAAQRERVARIDAHACALLAARPRRAAPSRPMRPLRRSGRRAAHRADLPGLATDADLRSWDLSIDPSDREVCTLGRDHPAASNSAQRAGFGHGHLESWVSTWSDLGAHVPAQPAPRTSTPCPRC